MASVLHVTTDLDPRAGGLTKAVVDLAAAQARAGIDVGLFATYTGKRFDDIIEALRSAGVAVHAVGPTSGKFMRHPETAPTIESLLRSGRYKVVHINAVWEDPQHLAATLARKLRVPYVWSPHGMLDPWSLRQSKWKKRVMMLWRVRKDLDHAAALAFTTSVERDLVAPMKLRGRAIVEPLGVDAGELADLPAPGSFRAKFPAVGQRRIVLFMSRVHYKKGLDLLIPAFAAAAGKTDVLVIAGPVAEGYQAEVDRLIAASNLQDRVLMTGMLFGRERLAPLVDAAVFVLPSYQENFGMVVAEALAVGCPAIISDQVNIWPEIAAARAALVVPTKVEPLIEAMRKLLADDSLRRENASRGQQLAAELYDWSKIAARWKSHYEQLAAEARR